MALVVRLGEHEATPQDSMRPRSLPPRVDTLAGRLRPVIDQELGVNIVALVRRLPATAIPATDPDSIERTSTGITCKYPGDSATDAMIGPDVLDTTLRLEPG